MPRHFRIYHIREDAADGSDIVTGYQDGSPWLCAVCGEYTHNAAHWDRCVLCNEAQHTWLCDECGHKNKPNEKRCETCGVRRDV